METYINNKLITKIVLYDEYDAGFEYFEHPMKKFASSAIRKNAKCYPRWVRKHDPYSPIYKTEDFDENVYQIDWIIKRIYIKPQVIIYTADRNEIVQYFNTIEEAREFLNDILIKNHDINIIIK